MTDVIDEKTEVETDEDTGKSPEAEAPAEEAQAADSGAETADDDSGKTAADADERLASSLAARADVAAWPPCPARARPWSQ